MPLLLVIIPVALTWAQPPCDDDDDAVTGFLSYSGPVCSGGTITLTIHLNRGDDDDDDEFYDVTYSIGGTTFFLDDIMDGTLVNHTLTNTATATLISIFDNDENCIVFVNSSIVISVFPQPSLSVANTIPPSCGQSNGSITALAAGGTPPYQYSINGVSFQPGGTFSNLPPGQFAVTVRDANLCITTQTGIVLSGANAPVLTITNISQPSCDQTNGSITVNASGGAPPYQYSIDGVNYQSSGTFQNLPAGNYTVFVLDVSGCIASQSGIQLNNSSTLQLQVSASTPANCNQNNGSLTLQATGGAPPYQYSINGVNYQPGSLFQNLASDNYQVYVVDAAGCIVTLPAEVGNTAANLQPATVADAAITECPGELLLVSGNLPPGTSGRWSSSAAGVVFDLPASAQTMVSATAPGVYTLIWTLSAPGCTDYSSAQVTLTIPVPPTTRNDGPEQVNAGESLMLQAALNDTYSAGAAFYLLNLPALGIAQIDAATGVITYSAPIGATGFDTLSYVLCLPPCEGQLCDTATVIIQNITEDCSLDAEGNIFPEGITPNGDGFNDRLEFIIIDKSACPFNYAQSELIIYNRWGDRVLEASPYDNDWDGANLPHGVYHYVLKVHLEQPFVRFGAVTVFRD